MVEKKPSTALNQEADVGVKWNVPARMIGEPFEDVGLFVGGVVVDDGVDDFSGRNSALDGIEEADELLVAMPSHAAPDHGSIEEVERGQQRGRAVALVVMGMAMTLLFYWSVCGWEL